VVPFDADGGSFIKTAKQGRIWEREPSVRPPG